jgi:hypothetical protein
MTLPMSWDEWAQHDGIALAASVRKGEVTAAELAAQAAAGIAKVDPTLSGVVVIFEDVIADPAKDGANLEGRFAGLPFLMKDLGPTMKGRLQEMGSLYMRGNRADADIPHIADAQGGAQSDWTHDHAGVRGLQLRRKPSRLHHAQSLEQRLYHLRIVGGQRCDGCGRRRVDRSCDRRWRLDPHSGRRRRQYRR